MDRQKSQARQLAMMEIAVVHGKANNLVVAVRELRAAAAELSRPRYDLLDKGVADAAARLVVAGCPDAVTLERLAAALAALHAGCREAFYLKSDTPIQDCLRAAQGDIAAATREKPRPGSRGRDPRTAGLESSALTPKTSAF